MSILRDGVPHGGGDPTGSYSLGPEPIGSAVSNATCKEKQTGTLCTSKQLVHFPVLTRVRRLLETKIPPATPGGIFA